jgi:ketosteroid isomerase-like protein
MFRKPLIAMAATALVVATVGCAQPAAPAYDPAADLAKLEADALVWFEHYAAANGEGLGSLYADDAILMPPGAPAVTGRAAIGEYLGTDAANSKAAGMSIVPGTVTGKGVDGDIAWVSGSYTVTDGSGATVDSGSYLSVHRRAADGSWPYIRDIWNSDRPPAAPSGGNQ